MRIRPATPEDIPTLQALYQQIDELHLQAHPERFRRTSRPARDGQYILDLLSGDPDEMALLVAQKAEQVIGLVSFLVYETSNLPMLKNRRLVMVDDLVVARDHQRRGVGRALMQAVEDWARVRDIYELELNVYEFNDPALSFYQRQGFRTVSRKMWKRLAK